MTNLVELANCRDAGPLRIAHITEAPLGGVLGCIHELIAQQAVSLGVGEIYAVVPEVNKPTLIADAPSCLEVRSYRHRRGSFIALWRLAALTRRLINEKRPDIVHVHSTIAGAVVRIMLLMQHQRPSVIYSPHCWAFLLNHSNRYIPLVAQFIERWLARITDCIVCVSEYEKKAAVAIGIPMAKCVVVHNGIQDKVESSMPMRSLSQSTGALRVLFVGRFDEQKGFDIYLESMRRLRGIALGTAVGSFIVQRPAELDIPDNVQLVSWCSRNELYQFYQNADLLLMPSRIESLPLVALEAMRAGLPLVASRAGGLPEIVVDRETGRLFETDDINSLVTIVKELTRDQLQIYGVNGRARFESYFTAKRMSSSIMLCYHRFATLRNKLPVSESLGRAADS